LKHIGVLFQEEVTKICLPFLQAFIERLPLSAQREPVHPVHIFRMEVDLSCFPVFLLGQPLALDFVTMMLLFSRIQFCVPP
jgi:hypothetical protein